eukprot:CAMPEP_0179453064 /NCGR_PEP_ID=MMETSP0799-20121207/36834_1 /TAXON_ID=46947 /ORGANISM="Geminigera cryophila, Strain CCMP2564" /LENGTH=136 /DNA_ID=CAMNT_0021249381 /DNA_START=58 /DNA_END=465 /DNA_ORIENTATION=-
MAWSCVQECASLPAFQQLLADNTGGLVVVDFTATWCGPCKAIAPTLEALADEYTHVTFVKVDVDDNNETAAACNVKSMPTFQFFKKGSLIHTVSGADANALRAAVAEHANIPVSAAEVGGKSGVRGCAGSSAEEIR